MNTTENNKLIAVFMGFKEQKTPTERFFGQWLINSNAYGGRYNFKEFYFDVDWNWLMEVVQKIESLGYNTKIYSLEHSRMTIGNGKLSTIIQIDGLTKIKTVYNTCLEFIKWYNEQNKHL